MSLGRTATVALVGLEGHVVDVEADLGGGLPGFVLLGLPDASLTRLTSTAMACSWSSEARRSAIRWSRSHFSMRSNRSVRKTRCNSGATSSKTTARSFPRCPIIGRFIAARISSGAAPAQSMKRISASRCRMKDTRLCGMARL